MKPSRTLLNEKQYFKESIVRYKKELKTNKDCKNPQYLKRIRRLLDQSEKHYRMYKSAIEILKNNKL